MIREWLCEFILNKLCTGHVIKQSRHEAITEVLNGMLVDYRAEVTYWQGETRRVTTAWKVLAKENDIDREQLYITTLRLKQEEAQVKKLEEVVTLITGMLEVMVRDDPGSVAWRDSWHDVKELAEYLRKDRHAQ